MKLTARDLDAARELPAEPVHVVQITNGPHARLLGTRHGIDASALPPLDIPQETEPTHTGRTWKQPAPKRHDPYSLTSAPQLVIAAIFVGVIGAIVLTSCKGWVW